MIICAEERDHSNLLVDCEALVTNSQQQDTRHEGGWYSWAYTLSPYIPEEGLPKEASMDPGTRLKRLHLPP